MKDSILVRRPISDGSSEYSVRLPVMTNWTEDKTLMTEEDLEEKLPQIIDLRGL